MSAENLPRHIDPAVGLLHTRRNILLHGVDVDSCVGSTIVLDGATGPLAFAVNRPARPCAWMDVTVGPGAQRALRGKGGVRCTPLTDGVLTLTGAVIAVDGSAIVAGDLSGPSSDAANLGRELALDLLSRGAAELLGAAR